MAKSIKLPKNCLYTTGIICLTIFMLYLLYSCLNKPLIEGVVFTPYDNSKLFTRPWDKFCIPSPPSCNKNLTEGSVIDGSPKIGCWCKEVGDAGDLDTNCHDIDYSHFY